MKRLLITTAIFILAAIPLAAQASLSFFPDADTDSERGTVGVGWWKGHGTVEPGSGPALAYTHPFFIIAASFDVKTKRPGYILAGPVLLCPAVRFGERKSIGLPVHALVGVADLSVGRLDYGVAAGLQLQYGRAVVGLRGCLTRYTISLMLHVGF